MMKISMLEHLMSDIDKTVKLVKVLQAFKLQVETVPYKPYFNIVKEGE